MTVPRVGSGVVGGSFSTRAEAEFCCALATPNNSSTLAIRYWRSSSELNGALFAADVEIGCSCIEPAGNVPCRLYVHVLAVDALTQFYVTVSRVQNVLPPAYTYLARCSTIALQFLVATS
jgi:hypothetical protein